ncbi:Metallo-hydrolase/oxidoreductase [Bimuria novae-zelandiae CBS 107.79]|uniref:Metallo-hydrolase/oxidoreductase n=1 Tax=Bimuria novae-zelandiae CBS 107.79 TaxID=1447943 RepID=A0A6A5VI36_9PLEO|nr:Metallo-hydrolase/oxidoreductase [Bimuria novae-zelandiae CBS 107.79]
MVEPLADLPKVERLSSRVIRVLGGNPSKFTLQGTNTYIVGTGAKRLLIDTGEGKPEWFSSLKSVLADENITIDKTLISHWHHDHTGGVSDLLAHSPSTAVYKRDPKDGWQDIVDGQTFTTEGATLRPYFCPGHTTDHMAFVLEEENAMFTADNVLGQGTAVFEDLAVYMKSLEGMGTQFTGRAYPGHGPVIEDGPAKVREYIAHRKQREKQVLDVLGQESEGGWTATEIVKVIYKDYPEVLWAPAEKGVLQILSKLKGEGKVVEGEGGRWSLSGSGKAAL